MEGSDMQWSHGSVDTNLFRGISILNFLLNLDLNETRRNKSNHLYFTQVLPQAGGLFMRGEMEKAAYQSGLGRYYHYSPDPQKGLSPALCFQSVPPRFPDSHLIRCI